MKDFSHHVSALFITAYCAISLYGCDKRAPSRSTSEISSQCGASLSEDPVSIQYGLGRPFVPLEESGQLQNPLPLMMEYGLQGGHHVDLSLRFNGSLDPDLVDISIRLSLIGTLAEDYYGIHNTQEWYLLFPTEQEPDGCYFHRARIFLFDEVDAPVEPWGVEELHNAHATLLVTLSTKTTQYQWRPHILLISPSQP